MALQFPLYRWSERGPLCIEIDPVDAGCFLRVLWFLSQRYHFDFPRIVDTLDGYAADFELLGCHATLSIDAWSFALIVHDDAIRAQVLAELRALPADFFDRDN